MDKKILVIILAISVAINAATLFTFGYFWWMRHNDPRRRELIHRPHMMHDWQHTRLAVDLHLEEGQLEEIVKINEDMRSATWPIREELFKKRQELMSLFKEGEPDRVHADSLLKEIAALQAMHDGQIFERLVRIRSILTPEQQEHLGGLLHKFVEEGRPVAPHLPIRPHGPFRLPGGKSGK
ncbi:MAG: periplasmic heavy metal sensor [candidate division WOR-3 bacterium]|nr:MAG: periplasmic heavy metal sensor [candidate division WOR-3 bacterium]